MRPMLYVVALLLFIAFSFPAYSASFTTLPVLPPVEGGRSSNTVFGLSADGSTVFGRNLLSRAPDVLFVWDATNGFRTPPEFTDRNVFFYSVDALSADGSVVAGHATSLGMTEAYVWDADGIHGLGDLPGGDFDSQAEAISADGSVVVGHSSSAAGREAFIWDATNGIQGLGDLPGRSFFSEANGVSADGSTVVGRSSTDLGDEAFIWDQANGLRGLGHLPGGRSATIAEGISADGSTVFGSGWSDSGREAVFWDEAGIHGIGDLPGGRYSSVANAASGDGSIIVGQAETAAGQEAFIWDAENGIQSLQVFLTALGIDLNGLQLASATGISADGKTISGFARAPGVLASSFIVTIPEPSTGFMIALGLFGLGAGRRKRSLLRTS